MALVVSRPKGFMDLPPEIRNMIYELVLHRDYLREYFISTQKEDCQTYYKIDGPHPHTRWWRKRHNMTTMDLLRANRQICSEGREVLHSKTVYLNFDHSDFSKNKDILKERTFFPGRFERLHSIFGSLRQLYIQFFWLPYENFTTVDENRFMFTEKRDWIKDLLRSLLPAPSQEALTALRSLSVDIRLSGWHIGEDNVEYMFDLLEGFITVIPAKVNVGLKYWYYEDNAAAARFGKMLVKEFAKRRAAHVANMAKPDTPPQGSVQEIEDEESEDTDETECDEGSEADEGWTKKLNIDEGQYESE